MKEIGRTRSGLQMGYTTGSCAAAGGKSGSRDVIVGRRDSPGETADTEGH